MKKLALYPIIFAVIGFIFLISHWLFPFGFGMGFRTTERTTFDGISPIALSPLGIRFDGVLLQRMLSKDKIKKTVFVFPKSPDKKRINVLVDSNLSNNLLSVTPIWTSRLSPISKLDCIEASWVTIWTFSDKEKEKWETWLRESQDLYFRNRKEREGKVSVTIEL